MLTTKIVSELNKALAGERLSLGSAIPYLDYAIDQINIELCSKFPTFSDLSSTDTAYTAFPDKYIRQVVIPCAAWRFYVVDEEGGSTAQQYQTDFRENLFYMKRDMLYAIPEQYLEDANQGHVLGPEESMTLGINNMSVLL